MTVYTDDVEKAGTYELSITYRYDEYPLIEDTKNFVIEVLAFCTPNSVTPSTSPSEESYIISSTAYETEPFDAFMTSPAWCSITYIVSVEPIPTDPLLITYEGDNSRTFSIYGLDIFLAGTYTVTVDATDENNEIYPGWSFEVEIVNPCLESTFTISKNVFSTNPVTYAVGDDLKTEPIDNSSVTQNNPYITNE